VLIVGLTAILLAASPVADRTVALNALFD